jgi:hypothetical protein
MSIAARAMGKPGALERIGEMVAGVAKVGA